jgi:large subunit ribosomal protein L40e
LSSEEEEEEEFNEKSCHTHVSRRTETKIYIGTKCSESDKTAVVIKALSIENDYTTIIVDPRIRFQTLKKKLIDLLQIPFDCTYFTIGTVVRMEKQPVLLEVSPDCLESLGGLGMNRATGMGMVCLSAPGVCTGMQIFVKLLTGKTVTLHLRLDCMAEDIKQFLYIATSGFSPKEQRLKYAGKQLEDGHTLSDYDIQMFSTLHLLLSLRGC